MKYDEADAKLRSNIVAIEKHQKRITQLYEESKQKLEEADKKLDEAIETIKSKNITIIFIIAGAFIAFVCFTVLLRHIYKLLKIKKAKKRDKKFFDENKRNELKERVLSVMNDTETICDHDFSIVKLAMLIDSKEEIVSEFINTEYNKNFRSFLNYYRIEEAKLLLSDPENANLTIESIAQMVGFKSRNNFRVVFKEFTGLTPSAFLELIKKERKP
jgi:AraC-like DNA-binding protein